MSNSKRQQELELSAKVHSKHLYQGKVFTLRQDTLEFDNSPPHDWMIIEHPGAVAIIPISERGNLLLIKQWRRPIEKIIFEIPAGTFDGNEPAQECAQRELQEEISYRAGKLTPLCSFYASPGYCTEYIHLFIAENLVESSLEQDDHEAIDVEEVSLNQALEMIDTEEIKDAKTILGILKYKRWLDQNA